MKILHISDVHLIKGGTPDQQIVVDSFHTYIAQLLDEGSRFDFLVFSGDLVQAGAQNSEFRAALAALIDPLAKALHVQTDRVIICPGNHDIDRANVQKNAYVEAGLLSTLATRDEINQFIDQHLDIPFKPNAVPAPFERLANFYQTIWKQQVPKSSRPNPFVIAKRYEVENTSVGVAIFNTAWRCTGGADNVDRAHLVLGERVVDRAIGDLKDTDFRIAVFHHPTDWLIDDDRAAVEPRLSEGFDLVLFGHMHRTAPETRTNAFGGLIFSQAGCLFQNRNYYNGFSVIDVDLVTRTTVVSIHKYDDRSRRFDKDIGLIKNGAIEFSPSFRGSPGGGLKVLLARVSPMIRKLANDHLSLATDNSRVADIEEEFVAPPLSKYSSADEFIGVPGTASPVETLSIPDVLSSTENTLIAGPPESGKTSIAHALAISAARGKGDRLRLPVRFMFAAIEAGKHSLWRAARPYLNEVSDASLNATDLERYDLLALVDNVDPGDASRMSLLADLMKSTPNAKWVLFAEQRSRTLDKPLLQLVEDNKLLVLVIRPLPRTSIRALSASWTGISAGDASEETFDKVMSHLRRTGLPRTAYIVSLILWTLKNTSSGELLNEAVLLGNIIDFLLNKMDYRGSLRGEFDFTSRMTVLQELAYWMKNGQDIVNKNDLVLKLIDFLKQKALPYDASKIVDEFIRCGIFLKVDDEVSFRYNRFQEYFVSGYLRDNPEALKDALSGDNWRFYRREIDLYTSRFRHESDLLETAKSILDANLYGSAEYAKTELEHYMAQGSNAKRAIKRIERMAKKPMTAAKIDRLKDRAERGVRKRQDVLTRGATPETIAKNDFPSVRFYEAVQLYSNVIRNMEFADSEQKEVHTAHCMRAWGQFVANVFTGVEAVFGELRESVSEIAQELDGTSAEERKTIEKELSDLVADYETQMKHFIVPGASMIAYHNIGSEKLTEFMVSIANDETKLKMERVLSVSIVLELDPSLALDTLSGSKWKQSMDSRWISEVLESRLYRYYLDRPMSDALNSKFVNVIADLAVSISGGNKSAVIQSLQKDALSKKAREAGSHTE